MEKQFEVLTVAGAALAVIASYGGDDPSVTLLTIHHRDKEPLMAAATLTPAELSALIDALDEARCLVGEE